MVSDASLETICLILRFEWRAFHCFHLSLFRSFLSIRSVILARPILSRVPPLRSRMGMYVVLWSSSPLWVMAVFSTLTCWRQLFAHGGLPSLETAIKTCRSIQVFYELSINNKHLVSEDYALFSFVIAFLNPYSHNLLLLSFFCHLDAIFSCSSLIAPVLHDALLYLFDCYFSVCSLIPQSFLSSRCFLLINH